MQRVAVLNVVGLSPSLLGAGAPRLRDFARSVGGVRTMVAPVPAVTCAAQATMLTGTDPAVHGIVGNGWFDRSLNEVQFWKQSAALVQAPRVWDEARARDPGFTGANTFWWYAMHGSTDVTVTPRPQYPADGRKIPDVWTDPAGLRDTLQHELGRFPLFNFWGPKAGIQSTDWIARAAMAVEDRFAPTLQTVYLPHLDYVLQKHGPAARETQQDLREIDRVVDVLHGFFTSRGVRVMIVSEYGIAPVSRAICLNRELRTADLLALREERGTELLDAGQSDAFAVCDHQVAHVYVRHARDVGRVAHLLERVAGVESVLDRAAQDALGIGHARSGDLLCIAEADAWFAYPWWLDDARAPDFARTVDIHRKPGYDPCELFMDPTRPLLGLRAAAKLALRRLGMRNLLDVVPLDPSLVRGSHGRSEVARGLEPILLCDDDRLDAQVPMRCVKDLILRQVFGS